MGGAGSHRYDVLIFKHHVSLPSCAILLVDASSATVSHRSRRPSGGPSDAHQAVRVSLNQ